MNRIAMASVLLAACLAGCGQSDNGVGPAQRAGKAIDDVSAKAAVKVQEQVSKADAAAAKARAAVPNAVEQARTNLDHVTEKVGEKVEQAGQKMQQAGR